MGFLNGLFGSSNSQQEAPVTANSSQTNGVANRTMSRKNKNKNNSTTVLQQGGVAAVNFRYPANMQQPSERVMEWATTAGAPMPPESEMRNVAHGGKRRTRRHNRKHRVHRRHTRKASCGGRRKTHHRRRHHRRSSHGKRRN